MESILTLAGVTVALVILHNEVIKRFDDARDERKIILDRISKLEADLAKRNSN